MLLSTQALLSTTSRQQHPPLHFHCYLHHYYCRHYYCYYYHYNNCYHNFFKFRPLSFLSQECFLK